MFSAHKRRSHWLILTSLVTIPNEKEAIEITTYRRELGYAGGRTKGIFEPADTFDEDSERRDLTINAMGMNSKGEVIDPQGGLEDLQKRGHSCRRRPDPKVC